MHRLILILLSSVLVILLCLLWVVINAAWPITMESLNAPAIIIIYKHAEIPAERINK